MRVSVGLEIQPGELNPGNFRGIERVPFGILARETLLALDNYTDRDPGTASLARLARAAIIVD